MWGAWGVRSSKCTADYGNNPCIKEEPPELITSKLTVINTNLPEEVVRKSETAPVEVDNV